MGWPLAMVVTQELFIKETFKLLNKDTTIFFFIIYFLSFLAVQV
jgi:hypothetical protein